MQNPVTHFRHCIDIMQLSTFERTENPFRHSLSFYFIFFHPVRYFKILFHYHRGLE